MSRPLTFHVCHLVSSVSNSTTSRHYGEVDALYTGAAVVREDGCGAATRSRYATRGNAMNVRYWQPAAHVRGNRTLVLGMPGCAMREVAL